MQHLSSLMVQQVCVSCELLDCSRDLVLLVVMHTQVVCLLACWCHLSTASSSLDSWQHHCLSPKCWSVCMFVWRNGWVREQSCAVIKASNQWALWASPFPFFFKVGTR